MPETAILMSVYGGDHPSHVCTSLASMLGQTYPDFSLLLMVDGPVSAELRDVVEGIRLRDPRVTVYQSPANRGLAATLNCLIESALRGEYSYLARMDADDIADLSRLEQQTRYLTEHGDVDVVGTFCEEFDDSRGYRWLKRLPTTDVALKRDMLKRCPFIHPTVVFRRRVFENGIRYRTDTHLTEDMFLWVDLARSGFRFANIPEPLLRYRLSPDFFSRRRGFKKALSEFRAKRYIADQLRVAGIGKYLVPVSVFALRILPEPALRICYRVLR